MDIRMPDDVDPALIAREIAFAFGGAVRVEPEVAVTLPAVGANVHYLPSGDEYPKACRAAIITEVDGDEAGLCVFTPDGLRFEKGVLQDVPPGEMCGGMWHWPEPAVRPAPTDDE
jgi:hypothetical protein